MVLVLTLIAGSIRTWVALFQVCRNGQPWMELSDKSRATWISFAETTVLLLAILLLGLHLIPKPDQGLSSESPIPLTLNVLMSNLAFSAGIALLLPAILVCSDRPLAEFGIQRKPLLRQVLDGVQGFLLALVPTAALMVLTSEFRNRQNQNALLTMLSDNPDPVTVTVICLQAVVIAPLLEEMIFRVILQGWLTTNVKSSIAIPIVAVAFAAIHGVTDGIALLPLAVVLGYVFDRRHSYISLLVIHALFNATMLALATLIQL